MPDENGPRIVAIGGAVLDHKYRLRQAVVLETSNPVDGFRSFGGVARNVAENLLRLERQVGFVSIVGDDESGRAILDHLAALGADIGQVLTRSDRATAEYGAVLSPANDLVLGIADMGIFDAFRPEDIERVAPSLAEAAWVFMDCNLPAETISALFDLRDAMPFRLAVNTVSSPKAQRLRDDLSAIDILFTNRDEAAAMLGLADAPGAEDLATALCHRGARAVVLTTGAQGYVVASPEGVSRQPAIAGQTVDVTGAGDAMIAGTLHRLLDGEPLETAARAGALLATLTIESPSSVRPDLSPALLAEALTRVQA